MPYFPSLTRGFAPIALCVVASCTDSSSIAQALPIGSPCKTSSQCGTNPPFFCAADHPGGYCKRDCKRDGDCPPEAVCAQSGAVGECHKMCTTVADCRGAEGYDCKPAAPNDPLTPVSHAFCDAIDAPSDGGTSDGGASDGGPSDGAVSDAVGAGG